MENTPLSLAHTHARNAVLETKRSNPVAASEEHDLAAAEFAAAAQKTKDDEAMRLLGLLEQHHKKLGQILKSRHDTAQGVSQTRTVDSSGSKHISERVRPVSPPPGLHPPRLLQTGRRDLSTSLTSELASRRGIPKPTQKRSTPISPLVSNQHVGGHISQEDRDSISEAATSTSSPRPSWTPPLNMNAGRRLEDDIDTTATDAPFQQFYSTFESLFSKLSAPLAFAGLPLSSPQQPAAKPIKNRAAEALRSSVDYSQLISRAALRAVRNEQSSHNPSESFYVVPTSGGTSSYAEIMSRADREERTLRDHGRNLSSGTNDEFVDASSTILPPRKKGQMDEKINGKTMEEIVLENQALKHLSDTLSKRLHVFEMSAQTSSAALAQSIRSLHLSPMQTPENSRSRNKSAPTAAIFSDQIEGASADTHRLSSRIADLEEILRKSDARVKKKEDENAKLRDMLAKYREKWENLKAGAKARREKQADATPGRKDRDGTSDSGGKDKGASAS